MRAVQRRRRWYRAAVDTDSEDVLSVLALAEYLLDWGRGEEAREWVMSVLSVEPDHPEARALLDRLTMG